SSRRRHTSFARDWSSDVCSSYLALTFGSIFETSYGFVGGASFGLTIATVGFLVACLIGVFHIFMMKKKGVIKDKETVQFTSTEEIARAPCRGRECVRVRRSSGGA